MLILDWLSKQKKKSSVSRNPEVARLAKEFRTIRSGDECINLLQTNGLLNRSGLPESACELLHELCIFMRTEGLGLEPNLLGRVVPSLTNNQRLEGALSVLFSSMDTDYMARLLEANVAIERKDFAESEYRHWQALQYFPNQALCKVQYAHALKEQNKLPDALIQYLDSLTYGAPEQDVVPHALYVGERLNKLSETEKLISDRTRSASLDENAPLNLALTSAETVAMTKLLHKHTPSIDEIFQRLFDNSNRRQLMLNLILESGFQHAHRNLLRMIGEQKRDQ